MAIVFLMCVTMMIIITFSIPIGSLQLSQMILIDKAQSETNRGVGALGWIPPEIGQKSSSKCPVGFPPGVSHVGCFVQRVQVAAQHVALGAWLSHENLLGKEVYHGISLRVFMGYGWLWVHPHSTSLYKMCKPQDD